MNRHEFDAAQERELLKVKGLQPGAKNKKGKVCSFRLLAGAHVGTAPGCEGTEEKVDPVTGVPIVKPSHTYVANEDGNNIVKSEFDLVTKFGRDKFQRLTGDGDVLTGDAGLLANEELIDENAKLRAQLAVAQEKLGEREQFENDEGKVSDLPGLAGLSKKQLEDVAENEHVDTSECSTKADLIAAIEEARTIGIKDFK